MDTLQRTARTISYVFNPLVLPPALFALVVWYAGGIGRDVVVVVLIALVFFTLLPLIPMVIAVRAKPGSTLELRDRFQRTIPYAAGIGSYLVCIPVLAYAGLPATKLLIGMMICFVLNGALLLAINLFWKISLHVATIAGCLSILIVALKRYIPNGNGAISAELGGLIVAAGCGIALMMWARVRDNAHSTGQVVAGAIFGITMPIIELAALGKMGLFDTF